MKKKWFNNKWHFGHLLKMLRIMKLTVLIVLVSLVSLSASVYSQQTKLDVSLKNASVRDILELIEDRTDFFFLYTNEDIDVNRKVNINVKEKPVEYVLDNVFQGTDVTYRISDRQIVLTNNIQYNKFQSQQQRFVSGKVTNSVGQFLPGVAVVAKGTATGTVTDIDGSFRLAIDPDVQTLVFSFIGMQRQEIEIGNRTTFNVALIESAIDVEEIVVVGYGSVERSDLTGSVSRVKADKIEKMSITQVTEALSGTVAGLFSNQETKAEGGASLELRGPSSLKANTSPLIVIDGAIYPGSMSEINPNDIGTIDVLRDASSAAIFGSRAASGVILITTKKGLSGKPTINFSSKVGVSSTTNDLYPYGMGPGADPMDYFRMHRDTKNSRAQGSLPYYYYFNPDNLPSDISQSEWLNYAENPRDNATEEWFNRISIWPIEKENYLAGRTTNFYDKVIGTGLRQDYNLSVNGGTENINYYWSIGYLDNEGIIKGDEFSAIRSRLNLDIKVTEWIKVGMNTQFTSRDEGAVEGNLTLLSQSSPYGSMYNEDGTIRIYTNDYVKNPLENYYGQDKMKDINSLFSNLYAELNLGFGITYKISYQPHLAFTKDFNYWSTSTTTGSESYTGGYGYRDHTQTFGWLFDNLIKWNKKFGEHVFDATFLVSAEKEQSWYSRQYNSNFSPNENLGYNALQFGVNPGLSDNDTKTTGDALMGRLNYTLMGKYLLTASVRRDGYSAFGENKRLSTFPAFAFGWKINEENFYDIPWMNRLKLRLSWGKNGNRSIGGYSALAQLGSVIYYNGSNVQTGVYSTGMANPALAWERTESYNIGLDIGLFNNKVDITLDAYDATTEDLLLDRQLPRVTGFSSIASNLGQLGNRGIEFTVNTVNISHKDFIWKSTLVFSANRNKIKSLWGDMGEYTLLNKKQTGELPDFQNEWFPGYARDVIWNYDRDGIWQVDEAAAAAQYGLEPGDYKAIDVNEDGKYTQFEDKKFIGYTAPRTRWGLRNEFTIYQNLSLSVFIRADLGHMREVPISGDKSTHDRRNDWGFDYWSPENPDSEFPMINYPDNSSFFGGGILPYVSTAFLRVQDLNLSYNIPSNKLQRILPFQSLRVSLTARNLYTITNWPGFDPESGNLPMPKTFTFGVDITL